ncbi:HAD family phosphatase [Adhaeribacter sp. BT258]|uniref:HAD family phosphatase n=1 Tax=Adhaeribacter terrigena TaxID=2793070 RepID=A0ABS1C7H6_9BACT|nr:HAD family phosphatase [Adhaeribacter terrigena]MBK0404643.1 HAD family phosphatase [Adhaeribacter terrigena]
MIPATFKNIIFDLGGVIINIDYQKTIDAFKKLSQAGATIEFNQKNQSALFDELETGRISNAAFREKVREHYHLDATDEEIDAAWNAMLLDIPAERIELLRQLRKNHKLFLLSNTNAIHLIAFNKIVHESHGMPALDELFDKCYYSHLVDDRKPNASVFEKILAENNLEREETLFVDDSIQHIESAEKIGIKTLHLAPPLTINQAFADAV